MNTNHKLARSVKERVSIVLAATALAIALFGSTSVGHAVDSAVSPFATHSKTADYARNAGAVSGIKASKRPRAGRLVPLGKNGKFPASVGLAGPARPQGDKGEQGAPGSCRPAGRDPAAGRYRPGGPAGGPG